jgi:hypothetical protein
MLCRSSRGLRSENISPRAELREALLILPPLRRSIAVSIFRITAIRALVTGSPIRPADTGKIQGILRHLHLTPAGWQAAFMTEATGTDHRKTSSGFAAAADVPIPYMQRTRDYYSALGYGAPYEWAHYAEVPFTPLARPLRQCRVALITTAAPYQPDKGDQGPGAAYNGAAKFHAVYSGDMALDHDLRISHVAIDRAHTTAEDPSSYFPLPAMRRARKMELFGEFTSRFHGAPTSRSHRVTLETDCPEIVRRCLEDKADAAILVPNCPVCHQTVGLAARALESQGIATVIMGSAKDIVEHVGVPRFLFSDFPLGNSAGRPNDVASQDFTLALALELLEAAPAARTTVQSPLRWSASSEWKLDYCNIALLGPEEIARRRAAFDAQKTIARQTRQSAQADDKMGGGRKAQPFTSPPPGAIGVTPRT